MKGVFLFFLLGLGCRHIEPSSSNDAIIASSSFLKQEMEYNLNDPDTIFILDTALLEISGLEYHQDKQCLLSHNDEQGFIFELDADTGKILRKIKFAKKGDYESIAFDSNTIYVAKHTGKIYAYDQKTQQTVTYNTELSAKNDVEGMCVDRIHNTLLLACKGQPLSNSKLKNEKCVYAFDLDSKKLSDDAIITIKYDELVEWVKANYEHSSLKDQKNKIKRIKDFSPSGLSFTNNQEALYVISARGSTLLIFDSKLNLISVYFLNTKTLPQPEGICFDKEDNLYISTEGQGFSGKIFKYRNHDRYINK